MNRILTIALSAIIMSSCASSVKPESEPWPTDEDLLGLWKEELAEEMDIDDLEITRQDIDGDGIEEILMSYPVEGGSGMFLAVSAADNCLSTILAGTGSNGYWNVHDNGMVSYTTSSGRHINEEADWIFDEMTIASYAKVKDSRLLYSLCIMTEIKDGIDPETVTEENNDSCFFHHCTLDLDSMELVIPYEEALKLIPNE